MRCWAVPSWVFRDVWQRPAEEEEHESRAAPASTGDSSPEPAPDQHHDCDRGPEESAPRIGQGQGMAKERRRGQPEDSRETAGPIDQAVEAEDDRAVEDLADIVGVAEVPGRAEPPDPVRTSRR